MRALVLAIFLAGCATVGYAPGQNGQACRTADQAFRDGFQIGYCDPGLACVWNEKGSVWQCIPRGTPKE